MQRPLSSWGTSHELKHKAHCGMQRILFTSCPSAELQSEDLHIHGLPTASTWTRDHQQKWLQIKAKWSDKAGPLLRVLGKGHNSWPHLPSQGKGLGEPTLSLWGHPTYTPAVETSPLREKCWWPGEVVSVSQAQAEASGSSCPPWAPWVGGDLSSPPTVPVEVHTGARGAGSSPAVLF